jgi:hypothetical protein
MNNIPERYLETKKIILDGSGDRVQVLLNILRGKIGPPLDLRGEYPYHLIKGAWKYASKEKKEEEELENVISGALKISDLKKEPDILGHLLFLVFSLPLKGAEAKNAIKELVKDTGLKNKMMKEHSLHYWSLKTAASLDLVKDLKDEFIAALDYPETCHIAYESLLYQSADDAKKFYFNYRQTMDRNYKPVINAEELKSLTLWNIKDEFGEKTLEKILSDYRKKKRLIEESATQERILVVTFKSLRTKITEGLSTIKEYFFVFSRPHPVKIIENEKAKAWGIRSSIVRWY